MAIDFNTTSGIVSSEESRSDDMSVEYPSSETFMDIELSEHPGLTTVELNDPNRIKVTITDDETPIVVLYGPPSCGKTMTMVRLTRYLAQHGYTVEPIRTFRPTYDENYKHLCDTFDQMINSNDAATSTSNISFMLVEVLKNGKPICQLLEAPGEYYFHPDKPNRPYPAYVQEITKSRNKKIWAIMVEPNWSDETPRRHYVKRIHDLHAQMMSKRDRVIFVYNKIDLTNLVTTIGHVNTNQAIKKVGKDYRGIFDVFENKNPITSFFRKYNCEFVPFMTGTYSETMTGSGFIFTEGHEIYAQRFWQTILKSIKG